MTDVRALPGLKEADIVKLGPCVVCGRGALNGPGVTFYKVTVERAGFMAGPLRRRAGLQMMLGDSPTLAKAMGPNEDLAAIFAGPTSVLVHEGCADKINHLLDLMPDRESAAAPGSQSEPAIKDQAP